MRTDCERCGEQVGKNCIYKRRMKCVCGMLLCSWCFEVHKKGREHRGGFSEPDTVVLLPEGRLFTNTIMAFPVKHHWKEMADPNLIEYSAEKLKAWARYYPKVDFILPRPGCGNGGLDWRMVKTRLLAIFDTVDNIHIISF